MLVLLLLLCVATACAAGVPAPWTPVQARGSSISCWGRTYSLDRSLLPSRIVTQADDVLTGPISMVVRAGGRELAWSTPEFAVLRSSADSVQVRTAASAATISAEFVYTAEFDGVTRVDMKLTPKGTVELDSADLVVPLKPRYAKLFHHASVYPVHVWDWPKRRMNSGDVPPDGLRLPFVFHLWLGNDDRGLQFFSETDQPWSPADPEAAITVSPGMDTTVLRMNLLGKCALSKQWEWSFGFVATPVKPIAPDYHSIHYTQMGGYGIEKSPDHGDTNSAGKSPPYLDTLKLAGANWVGCHEAWSDEQSLPRPKDPAQLRSLVTACHERGMRLATYTGCYMSTRSPEYNKDWDALPIGDHYQYQRPDNGDTCRVTCNNTGYPDVLLSNYERAFREYGIDGLYMDGLTCPLPCVNTKHGCGYLGKDGQARPTMPIWKTREMMKRFYALVKGSAKPGIIVSHMSSSVLLPALSFADVYLDGEHLLSYIKIGTVDYPESILRAEMSGHNFGLPGTQLPIRGDKAEQERARTVCLLHDIMMIWHPEHQADIWRALDEFNVTGAQWVPYWKSGAVVSVSDRESFRVSAYLHRGRGALLVVANLGDVEASTDLTVHTERLGLPSGTSLAARDHTGLADVECVGGKLTVSAKPGTFRMVSVEGR